MSFLDDILKRSLSSQGLPREISLSESRAPTNVEAHSYVERFGLKDYTPENREEAMQVTAIHEGFHWNIALSHGVIPGYYNIKEGFGGIEAPRTRERAASIEIAYAGEIGERALRGEQKFDFSATSASDLAVVANLMYPELRQRAYEMNEQFKAQGSTNFVTAADLMTMEQYHEIRSVGQQMLNRFYSLPEEAQNAAFQTGVAMYGNPIGLSATANVSQKFALGTQIQSMNISPGYSQSLVQASTDFLRLMGQEDVQEIEATMESNSFDMLQRMPVGQALQGTMRGGMPPTLPGMGNLPNVPLDWTSQAFAGLQNMPQNLGMPYGAQNELYRAQKFIYGGMQVGAETKLQGQVASGIGDKDFNEQVKNSIDLFKQFTAAMGQATNQTTNFQSAMYQINQIANNPQSPYQQAAISNISQWSGLGVNIPQALANQGYSGGNLPPAGTGGGLPGDDGSLWDRIKGGIGGIAGKLGRSYYAMRGPYREFVEPIMQDMAAYGQIAGAQFQQLSSYGLRQNDMATGASPYMQYANLMARQQQAQYGIGQASSMAWSPLMGMVTGNGLNQTGNWLAGVLGPSVGIGVAASAMGLGPIGGALIGGGAALAGTISMGISSMQNIEQMGRMYNAGTAGGIGGGISALLQGGPGFVMNELSGLGPGVMGGQALRDWQTGQTKNKLYGDMMNALASGNFGQAQGLDVATGFGQSLATGGTGALSGQAIATLSQMIAGNDQGINWQGLDYAARNQIGTSLAARIGMLGRDQNGQYIGQKYLPNVNRYASQVAAATIAGVNVDQLSQLYMTGAGGNQFSAVGTEANLQGYIGAASFGALSPQAAAAMQPFARQMMQGQASAIEQGMGVTDMSVYERLANNMVGGGAEAQRQFSRQVTRDQLTPGLYRQLQASGFNVNDPRFVANYLLGDNGYGNLNQQQVAATSLLTYGVANQEAVVAGGALGERGFNVQSIMANRVLGMGMNAASAGALGVASTALTQFNGMNNAQATVQAQAEAQAAQINLGYGAYGMMSSGNFNLLTRGFAQAPQQAAQFGALVSGNAIAWSQAADQGIGPQAWRTVQTGSQGGTAGMQAGYDERISAAQAGMVSARGIASGFIRGDGRYSISQISGMSERQRTEALYGLQIESRNEGFAYETANLERSRRSQLTERGFEDTGIALSRAQQDWGRYIQGQQIGIQGAQLQANYAYQGTQLAFGRQREIVQQGWQQQDLAYQRNVNELQYGFSMIDAQENIRYSTGRERRVAMRHQQEATVMFSLQEGQQTREEQRAAQQRQWSEQQFNLEKTHFEQTHQFEVQNFELTKQNYQKEGEFIRQNRQLEDQERVFRRSIQDEQFAADKQHLITTQTIKKTMDDLNGATQTWNTLVTEAKANMQYQASTGQILNQQAVQYYSTQALTSAQSYLTSQSYQQQVTYTQPGIGLPSTPSKHIGGAGVDLGGIVGMPSYEMGGYTGLGRKNLETGTVHAGEHVVPQGGSLVYSNPDMVRLLSAIHSTLQSIHKDGGNAMINIIQGSPSKVMSQGQSLYQKAYSQ